MKRFAPWLLSLALLLALAAGGVVTWRRSVERASLERVMTAAEHASAGGRWVEVRALLDDHARRRGRPEQEDAARRWGVLEFSAAAGLRDFAELRQLAAAHPDLAARDEEAAVWLWRLANLERDPQGANAVRSHWKGRERNAGLWAAAEFDAAWAEGGQAAVEPLLAGLSVEVAGSAPMKLRAALAAGDVQSRLSRLNEAFAADTRDADVRSVRAALLERAGQAGFARVEYVAALLADPANPLRRDALASFYLRSGDLGAAVETWREGLDARSPGFMWVRAVFWSKVLGVPPPAGTAALAVARPGRYEGWLASLPDGRFWDEPGYQALTLPSAHARTEPSVFWLRVLDRMAAGDWEGVRSLLPEASPDVVRVSPWLHRSAAMVADARAGRELSPYGAGWPAPLPEAHRFRDVCMAAGAGSPAELEEFLEVARGPFAAQALLVAAGWTGPAIGIGESGGAAVAAAPDWLRFGLLQARRLARGAKDALEWGSGLPAYPPTDYILATLRLATGDEARALAELEKLSAAGGETGLAAGWLLGTRLLEVGEPARAAASVRANPALAASDIGRSLLARALEQGGQLGEALAIHRDLQEVALDSGARMAREAFAAGRLDEARRLTDFWLLKHPDNLQLRRNLEAIDAARATAGGRP